MISTEEKFFFNIEMLKRGREKLINDFLSNNHDIFIPMFKYRKFSEHMDLSIEKYFSMWLDHHLQIMKEFFEVNEIDKQIVSELKENFAPIFLKLIEHTNIEIITKNYSGLFRLLLKKKIELLEKISKIGDKSNEKYQELELEFYKTKDLYEKQIERLKKGE